MKYRNVSEETLDIPDIGIVEPGAIIEAPIALHNSNLVPIDAAQEKE